MKFTKMHGAGNDYIYINCFEETVSDPGALAVKISDRHFGIGSDGLILIGPSDTADFKMDMYNADGSRAQMCGNGIRCVGKYVFDNGLTDKTTLHIETLGGIKKLRLISGEDGTIKKVTVNMGHPVIEAKDIPIICDDERAIGEKIEINGNTFTFTGVSMGNPHAVFFVEDVEGLEIEKIGPKVENAEIFPEKINAEFCQVLDRETIRMRVWERGSGVTLACGTGACASVVAAILNDLTNDRVNVMLDGGTLRIFWDREENNVLMTGPAETVFSGEI